MTTVSSTAAEAAVEAAEKAGDQAQRTSRDAAESILSGGLEVLIRLTDIAEKGAWKMLLALGTLMWLVPLGMEVRIYGEGLGTLSTAKFIAALAAGAFVLTIGATMRLFTLREMAQTQKATTIGIADVTREAIDAIKDTAGQTLKELTKG